MNRDIIVYILKIYCLRENQWTMLRERIDKVTPRCFRSYYIGSFNFIIYHIMHAGMFLGTIS